MYFLFLTFIYLFSFYLNGRETPTGLQSEKDLASASSLPQMTTAAGIWPAKARIQGLHLGLPQQWEGSK